MITVHGIRQCDTCRKALRWLAERGIEHSFRDFRADGLDEAALGDWMKSGFAERLVNRRSTTWRSLTDAERGRSGRDLLDLLLGHPTLIKRPVFTRPGIFAVGFGQDTQDSILALEAADE